MTVTIRRWDDPASWNEFVASVPDAHFQQSWEWGCLAPDLGGEAVRLAATTEDRLVGAMQVFVNRLGRTGRTQLYVPRGPAITEPTLQVLGPLRDAACALGQERRAIGLKVETNVPAGDGAWESALEALGFRTIRPPSQPRSSWVLDLDADPDGLLGAMKSKTRYNIRLAARKGVQVEQAPADALDTFYDLYRVTAERDDFFIQSKDFYARMFGLFRGTGSFCMLLARYQNKPLAAITLLRFGSTCWYVHGASSNEHRNLMAPYLLQWEGIRWAQTAGCTLYDFRAVPDVLREDQDMFGVYRFKEGFGGRHVTTMHTRALPLDPGAFSLWQTWFHGRFELTNWRRRRAGLSIRQFA